MADAHLYGVRAPKNKHKPIDSSTSLAFSSGLSSLITQGSSAPGTSRPRGTKSKPDLFRAPKKTSKKRSRDESEDGNLAQRHKSEQELGGSLDSSDLSRSRRKMEEKARLYAAMKRGDYVAPTDGRNRDEQGTSLVDFDRKWAEREERGEDLQNYNTSSGSEDEEDEGDKELVDYIDEFGRARKMTRTQIFRLEREKRISTNFAFEAEAMSARPSLPSNIIYGDAVQHQAFNPDDITTQKMADLAAKRDKEATPPPDTHYDATAEIRTRGTGFYAFSSDKEGRQQEMDLLEQERRETERKREERNNEKAERRRLLEERKKMVERARGKKQADRFLEGLDLGIPASGAEADIQPKEHEP